MDRDWYLEIAESYADNNNYLICFQDKKKKYLNMFTCLKDCSWIMKLLFEEQFNANIFKGWGYIYVRG